MKSCWKHNQLWIFYDVVPVLPALRCCPLSKCSSQYTSPFSALHSCEGADILHLTFWLSTCHPPPAPAPSTESCIYFYITSVYYNFSHYIYLTFHLFRCCSISHTTVGASQKSSSSERPIAISVPITLLARGDSRKNRKRGSKKNTKYALQ